MKEFHLCEGVLRCTSLGERRLSRLVLLDTNFSLEFGDFLVAKYHLLTQPIAILLQLQKLFVEQFVLILLNPHLVFKTLVTLEHDGLKVILHSLVILHEHGKRVINLRMQCAHHALVLLNALVSLLD